MNCILTNGPVHLQMDWSIDKWTGSIDQLLKICASTRTAQTLRSPNLLLLNIVNRRRFVKVDTLILRNDLSEAFSLAFLCGVLPSYPLKLSSS